MPTYNKVDMLNCCQGLHDFSDDAVECRVCGVADGEALPRTVAKVSVSAAFDVADYLNRTIPTACPAPNVKAWEEVRDALYALSNDTDAIVTDDSATDVVNAPAARDPRDEFIAMIARLSASGDLVDLDGEEWPNGYEHDTGGSLDALDELIHKAREIAGIAAPAPEPEEEGR